MKQTFHPALRPLTVAVLLAQTFGVSAADDLYISEYIEGSSNNKALEIANTTGADIDLAAYEVQYFFNGSLTAGTTLNLTGTVPAGEVYVVASSAANDTILGQADFTSGSSFYNGDDAITLLNGGVVVDSIGQIGTDPGSQWGDSNNGTQNQTLRRKSNVTAGDTNADDAFDPSLEWDAFPQDTFDGLGSLDGANPGDGDGDDGDTGGVAAGQCGETATFIHVVQGSGNSSPLVDSAVIVEGLVTAVREDGFFIQEEVADEDGDPATSEGLFIVSAEAPVVGNIARVAGSVGEFFGRTQLADVSDIVDCAVTAEASSTLISLPLQAGADLESLEGMQVRVADLKISDVNDLWRFGEVGLSNEIKRQPTDVYAPGTSEYEALVAANAENQVYLEDTSAASFPPELSFYTQFSYSNTIRIGDIVSAAGPLNFSFGKYKINPTEPVVVIGTREALPELQSGNLTIASFNVLNYFNGEVQADGTVSFDYSANRGASSPEAFELQQARIVDAIRKLDADVIGLMEIENDGYDQSSAIQSLVDAVNADIPEAEQFAFVATADGGLLGTDAIAVGLLYRPAVVTPDGIAKEVPMPIQTLENGNLVQMRTALLQSFSHVDTEERFAVAVNHFKSKGSQCLEDGASPTLIDTAQGSCNALRVSAAITLGEAMTSADLPERLMILGDLNAYSAEDPIAILTEYDPAERGYTIKTAMNTAADGGASVEVTETFGYTNVAEQFDPNGFSYWFFGSGQVGSLDHILVNDAMLDDIVDATHWNINAPEPYQLQYDQALRFYPDSEGYSFTEVGPYRSSDHDPFLVSLNLEAAAPATPVGDFNKDGRITGKDLAALIGQLYRKVTDTNAQFDLTGDGRITLKDFFAFLRLLR
ncbi:ExeM/NucH family extracellular endonuclease [Allohahella marinimesophila]|uniref:ExeM/NucH family extracellular endonuclease n=1 Tax=Allohahella marinimesophila TaxID=1054972 RepID=A0ABP7PP18_9GAMM